MHIANAVNVIYCCHLRSAHDLENGGRHATALTDIDLKGAIRFALQRVDGNLPHFPTFTLTIRLWMISITSQSQQGQPEDAMPAGPPVSGPGMIWLAYEAPKTTTYVWPASAILKLRRAHGPQDRRRPPRSGLSLHPTCVAPLETNRQRRRQEGCPASRDQLMNASGTSRVSSRPGARWTTRPTRPHNHRQPDEHASPLLASDVTWTDQNITTLPIATSGNCAIASCGLDNTTFHTFYWMSRRALPDLGNTAQGAGDASCWARGRPGHLRLHPQLCLHA